MDLDMFANGRRTGGGKEKHVVRNIFGDGYGRLYFR